MWCGVVRCVFFLSCDSVVATGEHVLPLSVVKLGFVLRGHEFLVDHPDESLSLSTEDQELARYDELKGTLSLLINHVSSFIRTSHDVYYDSRLGTCRPHTSTVPQ